jgi:hypothetical protein
MHWLTFIFGFLTIYCTAGLGYDLYQGDLANSHTALMFWGIAAVVFAFASLTNQLVHARRHGKVSKDTMPAKDSTGSDHV